MIAQAKQHKHKKAQINTCNFNKKEIVGMKVNPVTIKQIIN